MGCIKADTAEAATVCICVLPKPLWGLCAMGNDAVSCRLESSGGRSGVAVESCDHLEVEASYCVATETCVVMKLPKCASRSLPFVGKYMSVVIEL